MKKHPKAFADRLEQNMAQALEEEEVDATSAARFIEGQVGVDKQRTLGFLLFGLTQIHRALTEGKPEVARLHTLLLVAASEQFCLDGTWATAWELTGLRQPPWAQWAAGDAKTPKKERIRSVLVEEQWVAAIIGKIKDLDALLKRRGKGGGKGETGREDA